jgi:flagellar biosynthesis/type III secretory pathway M-ring protein FliF/YscJ
MKEDGNARLSLILIIDEAKQPSSEKLDEIKQVLRTGSGFSPARGDVLRVMVLPFNRFNPNFWGLVLGALLLLSLPLYFIARNLSPALEQPAFHKPAPQIKTLDDYVQDRQEVAAAVFRHWLKEEKLHG